MSAGFTEDSDIRRFEMDLVFKLRHGSGPNVKSDLELAT